MLGNLAGNLFLGTLLGNLAWEPLAGNPCLGTCSWEPLGNMFLGTLLGTSWEPCWEPLPGNLAWEPCLGTSCWEPLLGNLFLGTSWEHVPGNLAWEPLPGNLAWEPLPGNLAWEPLPGNPVPNLAPCGFGCSKGFKRKPFPGTRFPADLAAPTCSGTFTMAEDPKLTLLGKNSVVVLSLAIKGVYLFL